MYLTLGCVVAPWNILKSPNSQYYKKYSNCLISNQFSQILLIFSQIVNVFLHQKPIKYSLYTVKNVLERGQIFVTLLSNNSNLFMVLVSSKDSKSYLFYVIDCNDFKDKHCNLLNATYSWCNITRAYIALTGEALLSFISENVHFMNLQTIPVNKKSHRL